MKGGAPKVSEEEENLFFVDGVEKVPRKVAKRIFAELAFSNAPRLTYPDLTYAIERQG